MPRIVALLWLCLSICCAPFAMAGEMLTLAVASSFQARAEQAARALDEARGVGVRVVTGSTGRLLAQAARGAPFDVLVVAEGLDLPLPEARRGPAGEGFLGIVSAAGGHLAPRDLLAPGIRRIALPDPGVAPFGRAAQAALRRLGLWQALGPKLVYAANAMQAAAMARAGLVDAAFAPVDARAPHLARIGYVALLLSPKPGARALFARLTASAEAGG